MENTKCCCHIVFPDGTKVAIKDSTARTLIEQLRKDIDTLTGVDTTVTKHLQDIDSKNAMQDESINNINSEIENIKQVNNTQYQGIQAINSRLLSTEESLNRDYVKKITNNSVHDTVYIHTPSNVIGLNFVSQNLLRNGSGYHWALPIRDGNTGSFELGHPVIDEYQGGYNANYPVTVKTLKDYAPTKSKASSTSDGLMSKEDKQKLDLIDENANHYTLSEDGMFEDVIELNNDYLSEAGDNYTHKLMTKAEADSININNEKINILTEEFEELKQNQIGATLIGLGIEATSSELNAMKGYETKNGSVEERFNKIMYGNGTPNLNYLFNNDSYKVMIHNTDDIYGEYIIASSILHIPVTSIDSLSFKSCENLKSITIPETITSIGDNAFYLCRNLSSIYFNAVDMNDLNENSKVFHRVGEYVETINITIGNSVTKIPAYLFNMYSLNNTPVSITFEEDSICTTIGEGAFKDCRDLTDIIIPVSVTNIGYQAFKGTYVSNVYYKGTEEQWNAINIGEDNFTSSTTIHFNS